MKTEDSRRLEIEWVGSMPADEANLDSNGVLIGLGTCYKLHGGWSRSEVLLQPNQGLDIMGWKLDFSVALECIWNC